MNSGSVMCIVGIGVMGKSIAMSAHWSWTNELHCAEQMQSGMKKQGSGNQMTEYTSSDDKAENEGKSNRSMEPESRR